MLSTNLRTTQTLDPTTGVTGTAVSACVRQETVTAPEYRIPAFQLSASRPFTTSGTTAGLASFDAAWSFIGRKPMPKVDFHPDRWPLQSTS